MPAGLSISTGMATPRAGTHVQAHMALPRQGSMPQVRPFHSGRPVASANRQISPIAVAHSTTEEMWMACTHMAAPPMTITRHNVHAGAPPRGGKHAAQRRAQLRAPQPPPAAAMPVLPMLGD